MLQALGIRVISMVTRKGELHAMHLLQTVTEHGTVNLIQEPMVQLGLAVRRDSGQIAITGRVVSVALRRDQLPLVRWR